jgi:hypothetical protein
MTGAAKPASSARLKPPRWPHAKSAWPTLGRLGAARGLSDAVLKARVGGREIGISTAPNTLVVFEGALVHHQVTPIHDGERRIILSMTYSTDPRAIGGRRRRGG